MFTMTTTWLKNLGVAVFFSVILFVFPTVLQAAGNASSEVAFFELYAKIIRAVDAGKLDKSVGDKARAIHSELQKNISSIDIRLENLKKASMTQNSSKKNMLLDDLIAAGAERERIYLNYHQQLEQLPGVNKRDGGEKPSSLTGLATDKNTKSEVKFESVPENISTGQFD